MKKKIIGILVAVCLLATLLALTACYVSRPDTIENVAGTYKLAEFTRTPKAETEEEQNNPDARKEDIIKQKGIEAYLIVKADGRGYYIYKDNDKPLYAREVKITFDYDEDNKEQVKEIHYTWDTSITGDGYPGRGKEPLGVNFSKSSKQLTYYLPSWDGLLIKREYSQQVRYERISSKTDPTPYYSGKIPAYELANMDGIHVYNEGYYNDNAPYYYYLIDLNVVTMKANVCYLAKNADAQTVLSNVDVAYLTQSEEEAAAEGHSPNLILMIGTEKYEAYLGAPPYSFFKYIPATEETMDAYYYFNNFGRDKSMQELAQEIVDANTPAEESNVDNAEITE